MVVAMVVMVMAAGTHCAIEDTCFMASAEEFLQLPRILTLSAVLLEIASRFFT